MSRDLYRRPVDPVDSITPTPRPRGFPWSTVVPFGVVIGAGLLRAWFALAQREHWGAEPTLALVMVVVSAWLVRADLRAWRRSRSRS